jgi:hypothetical protein
MMIPASLITSLFSFIVFYFLSKLDAFFKRRRAGSITI